MRILFLSKQHPQQRDLVARPYGRFHHLPLVAARHGHIVSTILVNHRDASESELRRADVVQQIVSIRRRGLGGTLAQIRMLADGHVPDWIVACSDAWVAVIAASVANRVNAHLLVDAYDDFEAYMPWNAPLHWLYRRALREADLVTAAGPELAALLNRQRDGKRPADVLEMAADPPFHPLDRQACRAALGLPPDRPLIGYSGGWAANRGTSMLTEVFRRVSARHPGIGIALTGRPPADVLSLPGVVGLGYLPDEALPKFVNAMDVSLVITAPTRFGRSSYPAKLYEAMACQVPVVATATDPVRWILRHNPECLVEPGDPEAFAVRIGAMLARERIDYGPRPTWDEAGARLVRLLEETGSKGPTSESGQPDEARCTGLRRTV